MNTWAPRSQKRIARLEGLDPRHAVAVTAATEHITGPSRGRGRRRAAPADAVAVAVARGRGVRTPHTAFDATCATTALWRWHPWRSGWTFLPGREGLLRRIYRPWRDYFAAGCHPRRQDGGPGERWLSENTGAYTAVPR